MKPIAPVEPTSPFLQDCLTFLRQNHLYCSTTEKSVGYVTHSMRPDSKEQKFINDRLLALSERFTNVISREESKIGPATVLKLKALTLDGLYQVELHTCHHVWSYNYNFSQIYITRKSN